jgi:hypothetical protein
MIDQIVGTLMTCVGDFKICGSGNYRILVMIFI